MLGFDKSQIPLVDLLDEQESLFINPPQRRIPGESGVLRYSERKQMVGTTSGVSKQDLKARRRETRWGFAVRIISMDLIFDARELLPGCLRNLFENESYYRITVTW